MAVSILVLPLIAGVVALVIFLIVRRTED